MGAARNLGRSSVGGGASLSGHGAPVPALVSGGLLRGSSSKLLGAHCLAGGFLAFEPVTRGVAVRRVGPFGGCIAAWSPARPRSVGLSLRIFGRGGPLKSSPKRVNLSCGSIFRAGVFVNLPKAGRVASVRPAGAIMLGLVLGLPTTPPVVGLRGPTLAVFDLEMALVRDGDSGGLCRPTVIAFSFSAVGEASPLGRRSTKAVGPVPTTSVTRIEIAARPPL